MIREYMGLFAILFLYASSTIAAEPPPALISTPALMQTATPLPATTIDATPSLFFNKDDVARIEKETINPSPKSEDALTIGAILYFGPKSWSVWIRGEKWMPDTDRPNLHILAVTPDSVRLSVAPYEGAPFKEVTLRPYQTYIPSSGQIAR